MKVKEKLEALRLSGNQKLRERLQDKDGFDLSGEVIRLTGDFYAKQERIALQNYDIIDPESLEEYIGTGGYLALHKALFGMSREEIVNEIKRSGLRGRGGAGFPTGSKLEGGYRQVADQKYIICNADEGDPGAFMDRSILEGDPHTILEGMAIMAYALGASEGYIYVRAEYPKAVQMLTIAIQKAEEMGFLGENIMGSDFSFTLKLRLGAGAFVCGEATALIQSIEGHRGMPQAKVYRTNVRGLYGKPTVLNNVETIANIRHIINRGADWYCNIGTEDSAGTKVFCLVGKIKNAGLAEVPMGMSIREIVYDIGGGSSDAYEVKAVQTGGPSGGCIPVSLFDTPVDFGSLAKIGSIMGSGGMVVMNETDCMVDIAKFFMKFTVDESCGKCTPCRVGNMRVLELLEKITEGNGTMEDLTLLKELCTVITDTSLCGLGKTATTPVSSSMQYFEDEYLEHIKDNHCRAGVCKSMLRYIISDRCIGCGRCKRECPVDAIFGEQKKKHVITDDLCIRCGTCKEVCPVGAVEVH